MNIGLHCGICEEKHRKAMGDAIWLYMWIVKRQTKPNGLVLGGSPITYHRIRLETGYPIETIRRWMRKLRNAGYVEVRYLNFKHLRLRILRAKKFAFKQLSLPMEETSDFSNEPSFKSERSSTEPSIKSERLVNSDLNDGNVKSERSKQSGTLRNKEEYEQEKKAVEMSTTASAAAFQSFKAFGVTEPFGSMEFRLAWVIEYNQMQPNDSFTDAMERAAQRCQETRVKVPRLFFDLKRQVERVELERNSYRNPL